MISSISFNTWLATGSIQGSVKGKALYDRWRVKLAKRFDYLD